MSLGEELFAAEKRLLEAAKGGVSCRLGDVESPVNDPTEENTVRADFLRLLLAGVHPDVHPTVVDLTGARVTGLLDLSNTAIDMDVHLRYCAIDKVDFENATFGGGADFEGTRFRERVNFDGVVFMEDAFFQDAAFYDVAWFDETIFVGKAWFDDAKFEGDVHFDKAVFAKRADFSGVAAGGSANFSRTVFFDFTQFRVAQFSKDAWFHNAAFLGDTDFTRVKFADEVSFFGVTFAVAGRFLGATFAAPATFADVRARELSITQTELVGTLFGPIHGLAVTIDHVVFPERVNALILCSRLSLGRAQVRAGGHLEVHAADISAAGAEFLGPTIISDPGPDRIERPRTYSLQVSADEAERRLPVLQSTFSAGKGVIDELEQELEELRGHTTSVLSLRTANVAHLVLSSIRLENCRFAGAHGLDELRIDASCHLGSTPTRLRKQLPRFVRRRVIVEERDWRRRFARWDGAIGPDRFAPRSAAEIAGIYRDLRKGLEDMKDEPGAADFYYGEMEMRRLAHREKRTKPPRAEVCLLYAYWLVSGYGLRAWRAFSAVAVLVLVGALTFLTVGVASPSSTGGKASSVDLQTGTISYSEAPPAVDGFGDALELAGRTSIALLRNPGSVPELTGVGTVADVVLRLLTPVLLGFGLLALRGRTKR